MDVGEVRTDVIAVVMMMGMRCVGDAVREGLASMMRMVRRYRR